MRFFFLKISFVSPINCQGAIRRAIQIPWRPVSSRGLRPSRSLAGRCDAEIAR